MRRNLFPWAPCAVAIAALAGIGGMEPSARADDATAAADEPHSLFATLDADDDGQLGESEIPPDRRRLFTRLLRTSDADGNGRLSQEEFGRGLAGQSPAAAAGDDADPAGDNPRRFDPARLEERFRKLDQNGDGKVSLDEVPERAKPAVERMLDRLDADGDGQLSLEEVRAGAAAMAARLGDGGDDAAGEGAPRRPAGPLLAVLDGNGDGSLSAEEIASASQALRSLDRNGDGTVDGDELAAAPAGPAAANSETAAGGSGDKRKAGRKLLERLKAADKNRDGKLSRDEAPPGVAQRFEQYDTNSDGFLDREEIGAALRRAAGVAQ